MKKFTILFTILLFAASVMAQNAIITKVKGTGIGLFDKNNPHLKTVSNIGQANFFDNASNIYLAGGYTGAVGYYSGTGYIPQSGYPAQAAIAQAYSEFDVDCDVIGALLWTGFKGERLGTSELYVYLQDFHGNSSYTASKKSIKCPGTILASDTIAWADISDQPSTGDYVYTVVAFPATPVSAGDTIAVTADIKTFYGAQNSIINDTLSIGFAESSASSLILGDNGQLFKYWPYNAAISGAFWLLYADMIDGYSSFQMGMFIIVEDHAGVVEGPNFINGIKMSTYPNPASDYAVIDYAIEKAANVSVQLINYSGQVVATVNEGHKAAGQHSVTIDTQKLSNGTYFYMVNADGKRLTKKLVITK